MPSAPIRITSRPWSTGPTIWRWSRTLETPSSPMIALSMPAYSSGSFRVIQTDSGMSSAVAAGFGPSNFSAPRSSLIFSKASSLVSNR